MDSLSFSKRYTIPCLIVLLQSLLIWAILTYITIYWIDIGFSHLQVGILISIFPLVSLILMVPFGFFVDRISPKKLVIASQIIICLSVAGLLTWHDFWSTACMLGIGGIGNTLFNNALPSLYFKILDDKSRGLKLGIFNSSIMIGYGLGSLIAGFFLTVFDMNAIFIFTLAGSVPLLLLCLLLPEVRGTRVHLADYKADISNKSVLVFLILVFAFSFHAGVEQSSFSLYLNKDIGLSKELVGWIYFIHASFMAIFSVVNGILGDRFHAGGRKLGTLLYIGMLISGLTNIALFYASDFGTVLATRLSHALGDSLTMVTRSLIVSHLFLSSRMGGNLGIVTATVTFATLSGSIVSGALPSYVSGFVISGMIAILAIPIAIMAKPDY